MKRAVPSDHTMLSNLRRPDQSALVSNPCKVGAAVAVSIWHGFGSLR